MQLENFETKKSRKKKSENPELVLMPEKPKKERAPRKKIESVAGIEQDNRVPMVREKKVRRSKIASTDELDLIPRDKREDMIREDSPVPENLPVEPFEEPVTDVDDLSLKDFVQESSRNRALREQFGTDNESEIAQMLDQQVAAHQATVEVIPTGPAELHDPVEIIPKQESPQHKQPSQKPIQRWPETTRVIAPKERTAGFMSRLKDRLRNAFDRMIDSADDLDEE